MNIAVIGCGWLGLSLAKVLVLNNYRVFGTTTTFSKIKVIEQEGISAFLYDGNMTDEFTLWLKKMDVIILNFPPSKSADYTKEIKQITEQINNSSKVIFTSSTGVYTEINGEVTETSPIDEKHPVLLAENVIRENCAHYLILRLAGLIGDKRHPIHYLSSQSVRHIDASVNLVHRDDIIDVILELLKKNIDRETFNVCFPDHPSKRDYYTGMALKKNIPLPLFVDNSLSGKIVSSEKLINSLNYEFSHSIY
jgi:nucleoside-diphosphate-sugar epimerase